MATTYEIVQLNYHEGTRYAILVNGTNWAWGSMTFASEEEAQQAINERKNAAAILGSMTSARKAASSRENGKKGGRPMKTQTIADRIYSECFGHLDDTEFYASKLQEIIDWLEQGDTPKQYSKALADEWREYDTDEPNIR